jgi:ABC-type uncharacterized transport system substrate-binding protein
MRVYQTITPIPTIFFGIPEPVNAGIVSSLEQPGGFFSGVAMESASPQRLIKLLCCLQPHVKKIFIPYEAQGFNGIVNERAEAIINALTQKKFEAIPHIISEPQEAIDALEKNIENIDAVMLIEGCVSSYFATSYISYICALTERIFINGSSGLYSITAQGAAFGYGTDGESPFTQEILNMVQRVLKDKQPIGTQAVITLPDTRKLFANSFHFSILPRSIVKNIESNTEIITEFYWSNSPIIFLNEDDTPLPNEASSVTIQ